MDCGDEAMKRLGKWLLVIAVVLTGVFLVLRTPDTDPAAMKAKYGGAPSQFVDLGGGLTVHLRDEGPRGAPVIMLLHGSNADLHTWGPWTSRLTDQYRVIRFDQIGHGLTGPDPQGNYDSARFVETVETVAEKLGLTRFVLAGNSMGGGIALRYALAHPDRLTGLVLVDAAGAPASAKPKAGAGNVGFTLARIPGVKLLMESITPRGLIQRSLKQTIVDDAVVTPEMVDRYWELLRYPGNRAATAKRFGRSRVPFTVAELAAIKTPTLVIWGEEDPLTTVEGARFFNQAIGGSTLRVYPGIGHIPMEEAPDATVADLKAWLAAIPPAAAGT
jgi:pimeloyl-ACP methyl ester carboxylesterase